MSTENGADDFNALIVESGTGLPGRCSDNTAKAWGGKLSATNPFTPDLLVLNDQRKATSKHFKPTSADPAKNTGYHPDGPALGLAFEQGTHGHLFAVDSNQGIRGAPG